MSRLSIDINIDFSPRISARSSDPITSHLAAESAIKFAIGHAAVVLNCLNGYGPQTIDEIAARTGLTSVQVARRTPELQRNGLAKPNGEHRPSSSGCPQRVWVAL